MNKLTIFFAVLTMLFSSCHKNINENEPLPENKTMSDMVVNDNFDWKTSTDIDVLLTGSKRSMISINSTDGNNYHKGLLYPDVEYTTKITIPTYVTEIELAYDGQIIQLALENKKIEYNFN